MKTRLVVAMSVLGLISCPVLAAAQSKHKHHHHAKKHQEVVEAHDYKAMGSLPVQPVVVERVDVYQTMYDAMSQNTGRSKGMPDWFNRIGVSGGVNFDAHWGNRGQGYMGENYTRLSLNDAYLNFAATVNDWTKAFASLSYSNFSGTNGVAGGTYSNAYTNNQLNLEQGYLTIANYDVSPLFFQVGKQFTDFSRYTIHPIMRSMTQVMSESLTTSAKFGFITRMGLHGDIYAFDNTATQATYGHTTSVYGAALGFDQINDQLGYDVGIGYMSNLTGVNDIAAQLGNPGTTGISTNTYVHLVGGVAVYGDVNSGPFSIGARYTTAIQNFNPNDLSTQFGLDTGNGAKPWTADITAGFGYNAFSKNQNIYIGYQASGNAVNLALPKHRWLAGIGVDMWKYTNLGLEIAHDSAYGTGNGGSGNSSNIIGARASVKFG